MCEDIDLCGACMRALVTARVRMSQEAPPPAAPPRQVCAPPPLPPLPLALLFWGFKRGEEGALGWRAT